MTILSEVEKRNLYETVDRGKNITKIEKEINSIVESVLREL